MKKNEKRKELEEEGQNSFGLLNLLSFFRSTGTNRMENEGGKRKRRERGGERQKSVNRL